MGRPWRRPSALKSGNGCLAITAPLPAQRWRMALKSTCQYAISLSCGRTRAQKVREVMAIVRTRSSEQLWQFPARLLPMDGRSSGARALGISAASHDIVMQSEVARLLGVEDARDPFVRDQSVDVSRLLRLRACRKRPGAAGFQQNRCV